MEEKELQSSNQETEYEALPEDDATSKNTGTPLMMGMMKQLEGVIMERGKIGSGGLDFSTLTKTQKDKVIDTLSKHEDNARDVYMKRLEVAQDLKTKEINASVVTQRTNRYLVIGGLVVFAILTLMILFFKDAFLIPWLTFVTGLAGGFGLGKSTSNPPEQKSSNSILKELDEEG